MDLNLLQQTAASCRLCSLHEGRLNPVFSKGNPHSSVVICGMVPAVNENEAGIPFVGRAGHLLDKILSDVGWATDDVYITNLVKCFLAAGLQLQQPWINACLPYLITQIGLIKPRVILTLGKDASVTLLALDPKTAMSKMKGKIFDYTDETKIIPTYHPSYLLRGGGEKHKDYPEVVNDFFLAQRLALDN